MTTTTVKVIAGIDTHADTHHAAVIDLNGQKLGDAEFPTTPAGYAALTAFLTTSGELVRVGIEGTGSYGAGIARHLREQGVETIEVIRPNRQLRRLRGKSDPIDAYAAATTVLARTDHTIPKTGDGEIEAIRYLLVTRRSAVKARTAAQVQIKTLLITAPTPLREKFRRRSDTALITGLVRLRATAEDPISFALRALARRHQALTAEITELEGLLDSLTAAANPGLVWTNGIGPISAAQLLVTAGDNPERLRNEAAFAALCGAAPIPASSGKTNRHRLNRGGDRQANSALHRIALVRLQQDPRTQDYVSRKRADGKGNKEILRCLKRAIAREVFALLTTQVKVPRVDDLRPFRQALGVSLQTAADALQSSVSQLSLLERGFARNRDLANIYREWLETSTTPI